MVCRKLQGRDCESLLAQTTASALLSYLLLFGRLARVHI